MEITDIPHIIAALNAISVVFLCIGYYYIRQHDRLKHRAAMIGALVASAIFLVFYVYYKANSGFARFGGEGLIRPIYFTFLATHVLGAIAITGLVPVTAWRAFSGSFEKHRRIARITWPLWMWTGVSGVGVYVMTIHLFPFQG